MLITLAKPTHSLVNELFSGMSSGFKTEGFFYNKNEKNTRRETQTLCAGCSN